MPVRKHPQKISELFYRVAFAGIHLNCGNVQDAYSLRCTPQVNGAVRDACAYVRSVWKWKKFATIIR
jgi:histidine ammonia-lyase